MSEQAPETVTTPEAPKPSPVLGLEAAQTAIESSRQAATVAPSGEPLPPVEGRDVEPVTELGKEPAAAATPEPVDKLARARASIDHAKRQSKRRQREAEEAAALRGQRDRAAQQAEWNSQELARVEAEKRALEEMPTEQLLQRRGESAQDIVKRALDASTPEGQAKAAREEAERVRAELRAYKEQQAARERAAHVAKSERDFIDQAKDTDKYPTLARLAKNRASTLIRDGNDVMAAAYAKTGAYPSFEQALAYLEYEYARALKEEKSGSGPTREGPKPSEVAAPARDGQPGASAARTLTSRTAERALIPQDVGEMSWEEQRAFLLRQAKESTG